MRNLSIKRLYPGEHIKDIAKKISLIVNSILILRGKLWIFRERST